MTTTTIEIETLDNIREQELKEYKDRQMDEKIAKAFNSDYFDIETPGTFTGELTQGDQNG